MAAQSRGGVIKSTTGWSLLFVIESESRKGLINPAALSERRADSETKRHCDYSFADPVGASCRRADIYSQLNCVSCAAMICHLPFRFSQVSVQIRHSRALGSISRRRFREEFQRHRLAKGQVVSAIFFAHATLSEDGHDPVTSGQDCTRQEPISRRAPAHVFVAYRSFDCNLRGGRLNKTCGVCFVSEQQ